MREVCRYVAVLPPARRALYQEGCLITMWLLHWNGIVEPSSRSPQSLLTGPEPLNCHICQTGCFRLNSMDLQDPASDIQEYNPVIGCI